MSCAFSSCLRVYGQTTSSTDLPTADTIVLTHPSPGLSQTPFADAAFESQEILEKPGSKADNLRMLLDLNGRVCEVVTGVTVGA